MVHSLHACVKVCALLLALVVCFAVTILSFVATVLPQMYNIFLSSPGQLNIRTVIPQRQVGGTMPTDCKLLKALGEQSFHPPGATSTRVARFLSLSQQFAAAEKRRGTPQLEREQHVQPSAGPCEAPPSTAGPPDGLSRREAAHGRCRSGRRISSSPTLDQHLARDKLHSSE